MLVALFRTLQYRDEMERRTVRLTHSYGFSAHGVRLSLRRQVHRDGWHIETKMRSSMRNGRA